MKSSPISKITLEGREFLVKRDDLFDQFLSGNKYRKLHTLLHTPKETFQKIISYGGTQSNAMLAIAAMCKNKGWEFTYYTKPLNSVMKEQKSGNFYNALSLGMNHIEIEFTLYRDFIAGLDLNLNEKSFIIDQGGADKSAQEGMSVLAQEILEQNLDIDAICTPSGTGTTALFLAKALPQYKVYTVACVGDSSYLKEQMLALSEIPKHLGILESEKKYHFAKLYPEFLDIYTTLKNEGIEFDLLYAPAMWLSLLKNTDEKILYIHSGGVSGNSSMLERYEKRSSKR
jgi:1-aminocyclopropane-1-carboxylate deaminase/D-cysteine desulfhydrase-like pyridoxal-dependent ACC family enzyme